MIYTIQMPLPPRELHPNYGHLNGFKRTRIVKQARTTACRLAMEAYRVRKPCARAVVLCSWRFKGKLHDGDNCNAWIKRYIDGLTDAGLWRDDNCVTLLPPIIVQCGEVGVTFSIWTDGDIDEREKRLARAVLGICE